MKSLPPKPSVLTPYLYAQLSAYNALQNLKQPTQASLHLVACLQSRLLQPSLMQNAQSKLIKCSLLQHRPSPSRKVLGLL